MRLPIMVILIALLSACGGQEPTDSVDTSEPSPTDSQSSGAPIDSEYLPCSVCDVDGLSGQLVVVSEQHYRKKVAQLLLDTPDTSKVEDAVGRYSQRIEPFSGRILFQQDEFTEQRTALALETFYRAAESIASNYRAVDCSDLNSIQCGNLFIKDFLQPLYERDLTDEEKFSFMKFFSAEEQAAEGQRKAMIAALSSPHFLFRKEPTGE